MNKPVVPQQERLVARLCDDPSAFDPVTALRIAQRAAAERGLPLVLRSGTGSALAPAAVAAAAVTESAVEVDAPLISLIGPLSPLPMAYTELAALDRRRRAGGLAAFLDIFSARMTLLFAAAAHKYNLPALLQWAEPARNTLVQAMRALIGFGTPGMAERMPTEGDTTLRYAGLYAQRTRSAMGLQALAQAELALSVRIQQFTLRWRELADSEKTRMDGTARLGVDATAGFFVPDRAGQCRIVIGPVRYADFLSLEKGQPRLERLRRLVRLYLGPVLGFDMQIVLDRRDIPAARLGGGEGARLGWNAWARSEPAPQDSGEAVIDGADTPHGGELQCA